MAALATQEDPLILKISQTLDQLLCLSQSNKIVQENLLKVLSLSLSLKDSHANHQNSPISNSSPAPQEPAPQKTVMSILSYYNNISKSDPNGRLSLSDPASSTATTIVRQQPKQKGMLPFIPFGSYFKNDCTQINIKIKQWTGQLYYALSELFYDKYAKGEIDKEQLKMYFSQAIIYNAVKMMESISEPYPITWEEKKAEFLQQFDQSSKGSLAFLMRKYPIKPRGAVNVLSLNENISQFNILWEPKMNTLYDSALRLNYREDREYWRQIKEVLNFYIKETKQRESEFKSQMKQLFDISGQNIHLGMLDSRRPSDMTMSGGTGGGGGMDYIKQPTLHYIIGMKIPNTTTCYTEAQIEQKGVQIKNPEMLRIIVKWIQNLEKLATRITKSLDDIPKSYVRKQDRTLQVNLSEAEREKLHRIATEEVSKILPYSEYAKQIKQTLGTLHSLIKKHDSQFIHIPGEEVIIGLATATVVSPINQSMIDFLQSMLHALLSIEKRFNETQSKDRAICVLSFGVYDMLRAKCTGSKAELLAVYKKMMLSQDVFKIARVKNRMDTVNRDYLINFRFRKTQLICELQLAVGLEEHADSKKKNKLIDFSHFLYEMERSKYGPLTEAFMINNHTNPAVTYFEEELKTLQASALNFSCKYNPQKGLIEVPHCRNVRKSVTGFCCANCWRYIGSGGQIYETDDGQGEYRICFKCVHDNMSEQDKINYMLGHISKVVSPIKSDEDMSKYKYVVVTKEGQNKNHSVYRIVNLDGQVLYCPCLIPFPYPVYEASNIAGDRLFALNDSSLLRTYDARGLIEQDIILNEGGRLSTDIDRKMPLIGVQMDESKRWIIDVEIDDAGGYKTRYCKKITAMLLQENIKNPADLSRKMLDFIQRSEIEMNQKNISSLEMFQFNKLKVLRLRNNKIKEVNLAKINTEQLEILDLGMNYLKTITTRRAIFPSLRKLVLDNNNIHGLSIIDSQFPKIQTVDLSQNKLEQVPAQFKDDTFESCTTAILQHNSIKKIHFSMLGMPKLETLILNNNLIRIAEGFKDIPSELINLNLEDNLLEEVDFEEMTSKLRKLNLGCNRLRRIKRLTNLSLENLVELNLGCNYLSDLDMKIFSRAKLEVLYLHANDGPNFPRNLELIELSKVSKMSLNRKYAGNWLDGYRCSINQFLPMHKFLTWLVNKGDSVLCQQILSANVVLDDKEAKPPNIRILSLSPENIQDMMQLRHQFRQYLYHKDST